MNNSLKSIDFVQKGVGLYATARLFVLVHFALKGTENAENTYLIFNRNPERSLDTRYQRRIEMGCNCEPGFYQFS